MLDSMTQNTSRIEDISFRIIDAADPEQLTPEIAAECFSLGVLACAERDSYGTENRARIIMGGTAEGFRLDNLNPQRMVTQERLNPQTLTDPHLVVATAEDGAHAGEIVGFAASADAVTRPEKGVLGLWRWLRIVAVHPNMQRRGIGSGAGYLTYRTTRLLQPASAYTHEIGGEQGTQTLTNWHLSRKGMQLVQPFGEDGPQTEQYRHIHRFAHVAAWHIAHQAQNRDPQFKNTMKKALTTASTTR
jgi:GNAT superfamily N-acetyltransferase